MCLTAPAGPVSWEFGRQGAGIVSMDKVTRNACLGRAQTGVLSSVIWLDWRYTAAMASTSQSTPLGSSFTATQLRAGLETKNFS